MSEIRRDTVNPVHLLRGMWRSRDLIWQMTKREVVGRYKGSFLGIFWSFFNPVFMLAVYTFFFSIVFKARWAGGLGSKTEFALILFSGLMVFNLFSECINRAPSLIITNSNYVKKVVFPLEILSVVLLGSALFHMSVSFSVWLIFYLVFFGAPHPTILMLPIVLLPLLVITFGISLFLSSLGVYLRDLTQITTVLTTALMFLSPVFYPIEILPEGLRSFVRINPLALTVEQSREVMVWGRSVDWGEWTIFLLTSLFLTWLCFAWFQKTRKGFADVL